MGNYLFTPVTGKEVSVHILIKHWTGGEEGPDEDWRHYFGQWSLW